MSTPTFSPDEIDIALVTRLIASQFPEWAGLGVRGIHSAGTDNAIYRLGADLLVRLPRHSAAARAVEKELFWLPRLAPKLPLAIPVHLGAGVPGEAFPFPWSVYRWIDGETLADQPDVDLRDAAVRLGRFVMALQRIDPAGGPSSFRGGSVRMLDARVRSEIEDLRSGETLDADLATAVWESTLAAPAWEGQPVWLHADLYPTNLLAQSGALSAVIDFGGLGVATRRATCCPRGRC